MSRKRKPLPILEGVNISDVAAEGKAIARIEGEGDGMVVFIPFGAPGDIATVKIDKKKSHWAEGHIIKLETPSPLRVEPRCSHFTVCGGCRWQHLPYQVQLQCKQRQVADALQRIAKIKLPLINDIIGSNEIWEYRNKMEYTFSNRSWLTSEQLASGEPIACRDAAGFHIPGAFDKVLDITRCYLQEDFSNRLRLFIKKTALENRFSFYDLRNHGGLLRTLMVRTASTGEKMALMVFGEENQSQIATVMNGIKGSFPELTSLMYAVNTKLNDSWSDIDLSVWAGRDYIEEEMEGLKFRVGPKSFYQTNSRQAYRLYSVVRDFAGLHGGELVYDLYTGTGTIACFLARQCNKVIGIEYVPEAIADARVNARVNSLDNTAFYSGDMKDVLTPDFVSTNGTPDVMIVDPPRAGMHPDVIKVILDSAPRRLVYVSCNPATQARDLAMLDSRYMVDAVQPVDMFPHTQHVENVVKLSLRE